MTRVSATYEPKRSRSTQRIRVRDCDVHISLWGDTSKRPVFLLHGWGDCGATFQPLVDCLDEDFYWVAPDWRGFGDSSWNASGYWFPDYLADLEALVAQFDSPERPAILIGHSMGGNIASMYAGIRPDRVALLVNMEGYGLADQAPAAAPSRYASWLERASAPEPPRLFSSRNRLAERIKKRNPWLSAPMVAFVAECWSKPVGDGFQLKADPAHRWPNPVLYRREEALACWSKIEAPVLFVTGSESTLAADHGLDPIAYPRGEGHATRHVVVESAGHMLHVEQPGQTAAAIQEAFKEWL